MDPHHLEVLANQHPLQRGEVSGGPAQEGFTLVVLCREKRCLQKSLDSTASDGLLGGVVFGKDLIKKG